MRKPAELDGFLPPGGCCRLLRTRPRSDTCQRRSAQDCGRPPSNRNLAQTRLQNAAVELAPAHSLHSARRCRERQGRQHPAALYVLAQIWLCIGGLLSGRCGSICGWKSKALQKAALRKGSLLPSYKTRAKKRFVEVCQDGRTGHRQQPCFLIFLQSVVHRVLRSYFARLII